MSLPVTVKLRPDSSPLVVIVTARGTSSVAVPPDARVPLMVRFPAAAIDWMAQTAPVAMAAGVIV